MKLEEMAEIQQHRENLIEANADFGIKRYRYNEKTQDLSIYFLNYGCYIFVGKCTKEVYKSKYANQYV